MKVFVTHEDIKNGIKGRCYKCPVALAINAALSEMGASHLEAAVNKSKISIHLRKAAFVVLHSQLLPQSVRVFTKAFDDCLEVSPFEFELDYNHVPFKEGQKVKQRLSDDPSGFWDSWGEIDKIDGDEMTVVIHADIPRIMKYDRDGVRDDTRAVLVPA